MPPRKQDLDAAIAALRSAEASVRANQANVEQTRLTTETQVQSTEGKVRGAARRARNRAAQSAIRNHHGADQRTDRRHAGAGRRSGQSEFRAAAHHDRSARPDLGAIQSERSAVSGLQRQNAAPAKQSPALELILADNSRLPAHRQNRQHAEPGGSANRHARSAGRVPQSAAPAAAGPVRPRPLRGGAPHRRDSGAAARGAAEPEHADRLTSSAQATRSRRAP